MRSFAGLIFACAALAGLPAEAQAAKRPDLSGFWTLSRGAPVKDADLAKKFAPNTVVLDDTGGAEFPIGEYGGLKPKPAALAAAKAWKPADDMTLDKVCLPPSIIYAMQGPFPMEVFQGTEFIIMKLEYYDLTRIIFMNRKEHLPADAPHTRTGDSIGRWEGDTLVVDTTHLLGATITNNGLAHGDNARVIERFKLSADKKTLISTQEFEDTDNLENRGVRYISWTARPGDHVYPYECDPRFVENYKAGPDAQQ